MSQHTQFEEEFHDGPHDQANYGRTQEAPPYPAGYVSPPAANYPLNASASYLPFQAEQASTSHGRVALAILSLLLIFVMFVGALLVIGSAENAFAESPLTGILACFCALTFSAVVLGVNLIYRRRQAW